MFSNLRRQSRKYLSSWNNEKYSPLEKSDLKKISKNRPKLSLTRYTETYNRVINFINTNPLSNLNSQSKAEDGYNIGMAVYHIKINIKKVFHSKRL